VRSNVGKMIAIRANNRGCDGREIPQRYRRMLAGRNFALNGKPPVEDGASLRKENIKNMLMET